MQNPSNMSNMPGNNSNYSGPMLPNPFQGIPGNPIHQQIQGGEQNQKDPYVFSGGIFDSH